MAGERAGANRGTGEEGGGRRDVQGRALAVRLRDGGRAKWFDAGYSREWS